MDPTIADPVGATSRATAAARARETERPDRLFADPFAAALAGAEGFSALDRHNAARSEGPEIVANPTFALRTRFFDDFLLNDVVDRQVRQVVVLAAGLDTRAYRLAWPANLKLYELDQRDVLAYKETVLMALAAQPTCERHTIDVDLRESWMPSLVEAGFDASQPSVWLAEGLTFYLDEVSLRRLFADAGSLASVGDRLGADFASVPPPSFDSLVRFTTTDATPLFSASGWTALRQVHYDEEAQRLGRPWPYRGRAKGLMAIARRI